MAFRYPCYRDLKTALGAEGALLELVEISLAEFRADAPNDPTEFEAFITKAAARVGLHLRYREWPSSMAAVSRLYIAHASRIADEFFAAFRSQYSSLFPTKSWREKRNDESRIDNVLANIGLNLWKSEIYTIYTYYLDVRHASVHPPSNRQVVSLSKAHDRLISQFQTTMLQTYGRLPNPYDAIGYHDFVIFTRVIREIAKAMSEHARPTEAAMFTAVDGPALERQFVRRPERAQTAVSNRLQRSFGLSPAEATSIARTYVGPIAQR